MRKKQFETIPPEYEGEKAGQADEYAIGAFVRDGILAADFYENRSGRWTAMWRTLLDNTGFCNYDFRKKIWSGEKLDTAGSRHMSLNIYRRASGNRYRTLGDAEKTVSGFIRQTGGLIHMDIWNTLRHKEDCIAEERRETAEERKSRRIQEKMALAPPLPDDFDSFIRDGLFCHDHIMYVSGEKAVCTRCTEYYPPWEPPVSRFRATRKWYFPPSEPPQHIVAAHIFDFTINLLIVILGELLMQYHQIIYREVFLCLRRQKSEVFWNFWEKI